MTHSPADIDRVAIALHDHLPPEIDRRAAAVAALDALHQVPTGAELISAERTRQVVSELWTPEHDRQHAPGQLVRAGTCYMAHAVQQLDPEVTPAGLDMVIAGLWPWAPGWWKPKDPVRDMVRGAALAAAEIDRTQR